MAIKHRVMGLFEDEDRAAAAVEALQALPFEVEDINSPIPSHKLMDASKIKKSRVGWYTLTGGIIGFFTGFLLAIYSSVQWDLIVGGKPVIALVPFFIVGFEFTILFAVFGNIVGLITETKLPAYKALEQHDTRLTGSYFGVVASCEETEQDNLEEFFSGRGALVKVFQ
jgi:ActD protein